EPWRSHLLSPGEPGGRVFPLVGVFCPGQLVRTAAAAAKRIARAARRRPGVQLPLLVVLDRRLSPVLLRGRDQAPGLHAAAVCARGPADGSVPGPLAPRRYSAAGVDDAPVAGVPGPDWTGDGLGPGAGQRGRTGVLSARAGFPRAGGMG